MISFFFRNIDALDSKFSDESDDLADEGISGPERAYRGPHLVFPLQKKDIDTLIELFRKKKVWSFQILSFFSNLTSFNFNWLFWMKISRFFIRRYFKFFELFKTYIRT